MSWVDIAKVGVAAEKKREEDEQKVHQEIRMEEARKRERQNLQLQIAESVLNRNYEKFLSDNYGLSQRIVIRSMAIWTGVRILSKLKAFKKLPDEIIYVIIDMIGDDGISPFASIKNSYVRKNRSVPMGRSILGIPYGIWRIYTLCGYSDNCTECGHTNCVSNAVDIPIMSINQAVQSMCRVEPRVPLIECESHKAVVIIHRYKTISTSEVGISKKGLIITNCELTKSDKFAIRQSGRRVNNVISNPVSLEIDNVEGNLLGHVCKEYT